MSLEGPLGKFVDSGSPLGKIDRTRKAHPESTLITEGALNIETLFGKGTRKTRWARKVRQGRKAPRVAFDAAAEFGASRRPTIVLPDITVDKLKPNAPLCSNKFLLTTEQVSVASQTRLLLPVEHS